MGRTDAANTHKILNCGPPQERPSEGSAAAKGYRNVVVMGCGRCNPVRDGRWERTGGAERPGKPVPPLRQHPLGLLPLPVEPLIWD
jgi:hypothetical protein